MRKASTLVGFALLGLSGFAWAQDEGQAKESAAVLASNGAAPAATREAKAATTASDRRMEAALSLLPMPLGKGNGYLDLGFAYGVGLSFRRVVIRGLTVGVAPQVLFNIKHDANAAASKEYDLMARVAYAFRATAKISVYGEVLPGYSIISHPKGDPATGFVIAYGVGGMADVTDQVFLIVGVGYQNGLEKMSVDGADYYHRTEFWRVALGAGWRF